MFVECVFGVIAFFLAIFFFWYRKLPIYRLGKFPSPPGVFLFGHAPFINTTKKVLPYFTENLLKNDGIFQITVGTKAFLVISNYDFLEWIMNSTTYITKSEEYDYLRKWLGQGILIGTGSHWKEHRKILTPAFHFQMIETHLNALGSVSEILIEKLRKKIGKDSIDVYPMISSFALDAICESSMATAVNAQENDDSSYVQAVQNICRILVTRSFDLLKMLDIFFQFYPDYKLFNDSIEIIHKFDNAVIKERKQILERTETDDVGSENVYGRKKKIPFLDILLSARNEKNEPLTDADIREEVDTIMFAGYETTSSAISFVLHSLANHPDVQKQAVEEQQRLFGNDVNPVITYSNLNDMKYLEMVIKETLRLYPSVPFIGRKIHEDTYFRGQLIPKDTTVLLVLYALHRNPEFYPDPDKFDPTRFDPDVKRPTYSYLPFSAGPRNCIGQKFAMIEMKQAISRILRNFEILPATPSHSLELVAETSLKSTNGVCIKLKERIY